MIMKRALLSLARLTSFAMGLFFCAHLHGADAADLISLKQVDVRGAVNALRHEWNLPLNFEEVPTPMENAIHGPEKLRSLEAIPEKERTDSQKDYISDLLKRRKDEPAFFEKSIVDWKRDNFDIAVPRKGSPSEAILNAIIQKDPRYAWKKISNSYLVYPKEGTQRPAIDSIEFKDVSYREAEPALYQQVIKPTKLNWGHVGITRSPYAIFAGTRVTLRLSNADFYALVTLFCEQLGKGYYWTIWGVKDYQSFGIGCVEHDFEKLGGNERKNRIENILRELSEARGTRQPEDLLPPLVELRALEYAEAIAKYLKDPDPRFRRGVLYTLHSLGANESVIKIPELLKDSDDSVKVTAMNVVSWWGAREYTKDIAAFLKHGNPELRSAAVHILRGFSEKQCAGEIMKLLRDDDAKVREASLWAMRDFSWSDATPDIARCLSDSDADVRAMAVETLGCLSEKQHAGAIVKLLKDDSAKVRQRAASALVNMGMKGHAKYIAKLLKDKDPFVRSSAMEYLGQLDAREYAPEIERLVNDMETEPGCRKTVGDTAKEVLKKWR